MTSDNDRASDPRPEVRLEHRLTKIEGGQTALQSQLANAELSITSRLDYSNSKLSKHMDEDAKWMQAHDLTATRVAAFRSGALWAIGGALVLAQVALGVGLKLLLGD